MLSGIHAVQLRRYQAFSIPNRMSLQRGTSALHRGSLATRWISPARANIGDLNLPARNPPLNTSVASSYPPNANAVQHAPPRIPANVTLSPAIDSVNQNLPPQTHTPQRAKAHPPAPSNPNLRTQAAPPQPGNEATPVLSNAINRRSNIINQRSATPQGGPPKPAKVPKWQSRQIQQRLLQNKYVLDQEHERRFRKGMALLMADVVRFEEDNL